MEYRHYIIKNIPLNHGDKETEVELESLQDTGVGGIQWWKHFKRAESCGWGGLQRWKYLKGAEECPFDCQEGRRGVTGEEVGVSGWGDFNGENPLERDEKYPYGPKKLPH